MDIEIVERKDNPLLDREDISFKLSYDNAATPSREAVKAKLAALLNADVAIQVKPARIILVILLCVFLVSDYLG